MLLVVKAVIFLTCGLSGISKSVILTQWSANCQLTVENVLSSSSAILLLRTYKFEMKTFIHSPLHSQESSACVSRALKQRVFDAALVLSTAQGRRATLAQTIGKRSY